MVRIVIGATATRGWETLFVLFYHGLSLDICANAVFYRIVKLIIFAVMKKSSPFLSYEKNSKTLDIFNTANIA